MPLLSNLASRQGLVGAGVVVLGAVLAYGAWQIPSAAGYAGVGPNFLPWVVAAMLVLCGVLLVREARTGGFRDMDEPSGAERGDWASFAWMSAGILLNAALIEKIGFIFSCGLCFLLAMQGLRRAQGLPSGGVRGWLTAAAIGVAIAAPVYWMFTKLLAIHLPGLTDSGWL
jgi:putative tricarboxylic transport membrane protein